MADNTVLNTGSGGDTIATDDIGGVKHQRVKVEFGADGSATDVSTSNPLPVNIIDDVNVYTLSIPPQAVGANKVMFDLHNATGSTKTLRVKSVLAFPLLDTAVTGTLGVRLHLTRTSAVGTGGTAAGNDDATLTNPSITKNDTTLSNVPTQVTARAAPTGGATAGAQICLRHMFTEETNAGTAIAAALGVEFVHTAGHDLYVPENAGIRVVQGAVASVGSISFEVNFELV